MGNIRMRVDESADLTIYVAEGYILATDIKNAITEFYDGVVTKHVLWDLSRGDFSGVSPSEITGFADIPRNHLEARAGGKTAIVTGEDLLAFGLSRMYEIQADMKRFNFETRTFQTMDEAMAWLGVES